MQVQQFQTGIDMKEKIECKEIINTNIDSDGNLELVYKSQNGGLLTLMAPPLAILAAVLGITASVYTNYLLGGLVFTLVIILPLFLALRKEKITIVKDQGIKFNSRRVPFREQQIPYSSIDKFRIANLTNIQGHKYEIMVDVRGRAIRLTNSVDGVLAKKIVELLVAHAPPVDA